MKMSPTSNTLLQAWNALSEQLEREFGLTSIEVANIQLMAEAVKTASAILRELEKDK